MYHRFFIHSYVNGHLGRCQVLAIVNSATVNIGVYVSFFNFGGNANWYSHYGEQYRDSFKI